MCKINFTLSGVGNSFDKSHNTKLNTKYFLNHKFAKNSLKKMNKEENKNQLSIFKKVAFLEGCSYLLFFVTMPIKYVLKIPQPNYVVGTVHGILFLSYCILLVIVWYKYKWNFVKACLVFVVSLLPFGTFWAASKIFNSNKNINNKY